MTVARPKLQEAAEAPPPRDAGKTACETEIADGIGGDDYSWWTWPQDDLEEGDDIATAVK